jgi:hypothetical protein
MQNISFNRSRLGEGIKMMYVIVTFVALAIAAGFTRLKRDERARSNGHSALDAWHADESMLCE